MTLGLRDRLVLCAAGLAAGMLGSACSDSGRSGAARLEHLQLRRIPSQKAVREPVRVVSLQLPGEVRRWGESVKRPAAFTDVGGCDVRLWRGGGQVSLR